MKFVVFAIVSFVMSFVGSISAQIIEPPEIEWEKTSQNNTIKEGYSAQQTNDGGYIVAGNVSLNYRGWDVLLDKTDAFGNLIWEKTFGGDASDYSTSVQQTDDGGYIVAGHTDSFGAGNLDFYLIKTDVSGNLVWEKTFGGTGAEEGFSAQQTTDGGYIIVGNTDSFGAGGNDVFLVKTDTLGNLLWQKTFGGEGQDWGKSIQQTSDGGYIIAGLTASFEASNARTYLVKTDTLGNLLWQKTFSVGFDSLGFSVQQTNDGGYIITGDTRLFVNSDHDAYLVKTDASGSLIWKKTFGGERTELSYSVQQTNDGGYIIAGITYVGAGGYDVYLVKTDVLGNLVWEKTFGSEADDRGYSIQQTSDGGYIIASSTYSDSISQKYTYLVKLYPADIPLPPQNVTAQLRSTQSAKVEWKNIATDVEKFIIEKKSASVQGGGGAVTEGNDWQAISEVAFGKDTYIDPVLPPNQEISYRVTAVNKNVSSLPSKPAAITTPNDFRVQLKIYDSTQDKWVDLKPNDVQFKADYGTAVIVHGWQFPGSSSPITGWVKEMAQAMHSRLNKIDKQANIIAWEWIPEATSKDPYTAAGKADNETQKLKSSLAGIFPRDYTGPIHFMGHSLGSHIVTLTAILLHTGHPAFQNTFPPSQITLWDTPDAGVGIGNLDINSKYLRSKGVYIDSYAGCTNILSHNAHFRVDVPCINLVTCGFLTRLPYSCHSEPHEWYQETVDGKKLHLKKSTTCRDPDWEVNIGFNTSILLSANPQSPDDLQRPAIEGCDQEGTLEFSKLSICSLQVSGDAFGLDNPLECPTPKLPLQEHTQDVTGGNFWTDEFYQCNCSYANSTEAIIGIGRRGQGGGAQMEQLAARYTLNFVVNPQWDYISFEYDFTSAPAPADLEVTLISQESSYPLFSINSDTVFNGAYLVSGLRNIREFHNQQVILQIDLTSTRPDAYVNIRNITFWKDPYNGNQPPVVDAGEDQVFTVNCHELVSVTLDGTSSYDLDSDNLEFRWFNRGELLAIGQEQTLELLSGDYTIALVIRDGANNTVTDEMKITISAQCPFIRGDSNIDGTVDISDAINTLGHLFTGQSNALCKDASDANDDGAVDISDAIHTLSFLFTGGKNIPEPHPNKGIDTTEDTLDCREYKH